MVTIDGSNGDFWPTCLNRNSHSRSQGCQGAARAGEATPMIAWRDACPYRSYYTAPRRRKASRRALNSFCQTRSSPRWNSPDVTLTCTRARIARAGSDRFCSSPIAYHPLLLRPGPAPPPRQAKLASNCNKVAGATRHKFLHTQGNGGGIWTPGKRIY
jgi:hypothetical protein